MEFQFVDSIRLYAARCIQLTSATDCKMKH
jgi:hypothetical protein